MMMKKSVLSFTIAGAILVGGVSPAISPLQISTVSAAEQGMTIETTTIEKESQYVEQGVRLPVMKGLKDKAFQQSLNKQIQAFYEERIQTLEEDAKSFAGDAEEKGFPFQKFGLFINYKMKQRGDLVSLVLITSTYSGGANMNSVVDSYNFYNQKDAKSVNLTDLAPPQKLEKLARQAVTEQIDNYFGLDQLVDNQAFYAEGNELVLIFDEYEVAPGVAGTPSVTIPFSALQEKEEQQEVNVNARKVSVNGQELQTYQSGTTTMVEVRKLAAAFGYHVKWNGPEQSVELTRGAQWTKLKLGENRYTYAKMAPFQLEEAPELKQGKTYVPASFAVEVLKATPVMDGETLQFITK
ncbi:stalk domain-containing protein [Bacillus tianshenii]|nr:stalk domain-containing protein [Bacillus tianshenii]